MPIINPTAQKTYEQSPELTRLLKMMEEKRGSNKDWLARDIVLSKFMATFDNSKRVFCRGEWYGETFHSPAILVYDVPKREIEVWATKPDDHALFLADFHSFNSTVPYVSVSKEVFDETNNTL